MMKTRIFSAAGLAAALLLAGAAQAATTDPVGNGSDYPAYAPSTSHLTRAEVEAEVVQAQRNGTMVMHGDDMNTYGEAERPSTLTREQVRKEAAEARRAGKIPQGNGYFGE